MIRFRCSNCAKDLECFEGMVGLAIRCRYCSATIQVPHQDETNIKEGHPEPILAPTPKAANEEGIAALPTAELPAIKTTAITESMPALARPDVGFAEGDEPPAPPADIPESTLQLWVETWFKMGMRVPDMEAKLVERGCSSRFAHWYVKRALEARVDGVFQAESRAMAWQLVLGIVSVLGGVAWITIWILRYGPFLPVWIPYWPPWPGMLLLFIGFSLLLRWYRSRAPAN